MSQAIAGAQSRDIGPGVPRQTREQRMAIVFITGSTDGLGRAAAQSLLDQGHRVVLHARSADRACSTTRCP